jgi:hypothetical protein
VSCARNPPTCEIYRYNQLRIKQPTTESKHTSESRPKMNHEGHEMGGDGSGNSGSDSDSGHAMGGHSTIFQSTIMTTLFSSDWTTASEGAYAGTCIFLIVLAIIARLLVALKGYMEARWESQDTKRRFIAVNGKAPLAERISQDRESKQMVLSENGVEEHVYVVAKKTQQTRPWRFSVDPVRALLDTVIVGIGYLL